MAVVRLRRVLPSTIVAGTVVAAGGTLAARVAGYRLGRHTVVRCRQGHLFETTWIPGVKLRSLDLAVVRLQRCPVGHHWSVVHPVRESELSAADRAEAAANRDPRRR